ncbi:MAG: TRAP transporter small permease subunit [Elusimicrobiota bacterium]|jgi:C4-dicarboxylate transporter DctQ subunit
MKKTCSLIESRLLAAERALLALFLGLLIALSVLQVILRGVFSSGWVWADLLLRHLILLIALLGAGTASAEGKQFAIDGLSRLLTGRSKAAAALAAQTFTLGVCLLLAHAALRFARDEFAAGRTLLSIGGFELPQWVFAAAVPAGFLLLALHSALQALCSISDVKA